MSAATDKCRDCGRARALHYANGDCWHVQPTGKFVEPVEPGTPVYEVTVTETRLVTITRVKTVLGGTEEWAKAEAQLCMDLSWERIAQPRASGDKVELGPVIPDEPF